MPKSWDESVDAHRRAVRDDALDGTAALVQEQGLASVTMTQIARRAGIGRATLYRYFPDMDAILLAWHERQVGAHLAHLTAVRDRTADPTERLAAVATAYVRMARNHDGSDLAEALHRGNHVVEAHATLQDFMRDLIADGAAAGVLRTDTPPGELARFALYALTAARTMGSTAAAERLVVVTLDALRAKER